MPLVRIAMPKDKTPEYRRAISLGIQRALVETFNVPEDDFFRSSDEISIPNPDSRIRSWKIVFCDFFGFVSN